MARLLRGTGPGRTIDSFIIEAETEAESELLREIRAFTWFGDGCLHLVGENPNGLGTVTIGIRPKPAEPQEPATFTCPKCGATHNRGWYGGIPGNYRCLACGYMLLRSRRPCPQCGHRRWLNPVVAGSPKPPTEGGS